MKHSSSEQAAAVAFNQQAWNAMARAGDRLYLAATTDEISRARVGDWKIRVTPQKSVPRRWFADWQTEQPAIFSGERILCLAAGGGRQGPILAAAGAEVTVFDVSDEQLARDRVVAEREKLKLNLVSGDMANLSQFSDDHFDLVLNPCSVCFVPAVRPIWNECYRVLKPGGALITGFINPVYYLFDTAEMDKKRLLVRHAIPYSDFDLPAEERQRLLGDRPREFGHTLDDLIAGQLDVGFSLNGFYEDGWGGGDLLSSLINIFAATRSVKRV